MSSEWDNIWGTVPSKWWAPEKRRLMQEHLHPPGKPQPSAVVATSGDKRKMPWLPNADWSSKSLWFIQEQQLRNIHKNAGGATSVHPRTYSMTCCHKYLLVQMCNHLQLNILPNKCNIHCCLSSVCLKIQWPPVFKVRCVRFMGI